MATRALRRSAVFTSLADIFTGLACWRHSVGNEVQGKARPAWDAPSQIYMKMAASHAVRVLPNLH